MQHPHIIALWKNLDIFLTRCGQLADTEKPQELLEIGASEIHKTAVDYFPKNVRVKTLDITPITNPDYLGDICKKNDTLEDNYFDFLCCCEVLEHTNAPWEAPKEIWRVLKPNGYAIISVPFNLFIHPPLPDYWRFSNFGLRELFKQFEIVELKELQVQGGSPIQYTLIAKKVVS